MNGLTSAHQFWSCPHWSNPLSDHVSVAPAGGTPVSPFAGESGDGVSGRANVEQSQLHSPPGFGRAHLQLILHFRPSQNPEDSAGGSQSSFISTTPFPQSGLGGSSGGGSSGGGSPPAFISQVLLLVHEHVTIHVVQFPVSQAAGQEGLQFVFLVQVPLLQWQPPPLHDPHPLTL